jgi:hypothetical protein
MQMKGSATIVRGPLESEREFFNSHRDLHLLIRREFCDGVKGICC